MTDRDEIIKHCQDALDQIETDDTIEAALLATATVMPFILGVLLDIRDTVMEVKKNG